MTDGSSQAAAGGKPFVEVNGCCFPTHLSYDVPNHMWYERLADGRIRVGMTVVGPALADNRIFAFTPKRIGRELESGKSCATIESGKWVGPARIAFDGIVDDVNQSLIDTPATLVSDPYGAGWMLIAATSDAAALDALVSGDDIAAAYTDWMVEHDFPGCSAIPQT